MPVQFDHIHHPVTVTLPDGKKVTHTPTSCMICFQNMKDTMANRIGKTFDKNIEALQQLKKKKKK